MPPPVHPFVPGQAFVARRYMETCEFDFHLPPELIAQSAAEPRDRSRLLVVERSGGAVREAVFHEIADLLSTGDALVLNDTRVMSARLQGRRRSGGRCELLLLHDMGGGAWQALVRPGRKLPPGSEMLVCEDVVVKVLERTADGGRIVAFPSAQAAQAAMHTAGCLPLPPYIHQPLADPERYQTVFGDKEGSCAASTAALHFTPGLLEAIRHKGVSVVYVTLHMGLGSFRPIREELLEQHAVPAECYVVPPETAAAVRRARAGGGRVVACGTSVTRALETAGAGGEVQAGPGETRLFITPGHRFRVVDALITNLHFPRSSHLVLVNAFAGRELTARAYDYAVSHRFRFYSLGDAMVVV